MESIMTRRAATSLFAALFALLMALAIAPGAAFAADSSGWTGEHDATQDDANWTAAIADPASDAGKEVVFTLYTQYADEDAVAGKEFTRADLLELAAANEDTLGFGYGNAQFTVDKYVTFDQLASKVGKKGLTVTDEDTLAFTCTDGPYTKLEGLNNETLKADNKFFAGVSYNEDKTFNFSELGTERNAPAVIALSYNSSKWADNVGKSAATIWNETSPYYGSLRWFCGTTKEAVTGANAALPGGFNSPNGVVGITVKTPASDSFVVYSQKGEKGTATVAKNYTRADLEKLATSGKKGFLWVSNNAWAIGATTNSIELDKLIADAGLKLEKGDSVVFAAPDGFKTTLTYDQINTEKYFYPAATGTDVDTANPVEVGTVLALNWVTKAVEGTAASTLNSAVEGSLTNQYRLFTGVSEENYKAMKAAGNRFATNPKTLTVIKSENATTDGKAGDTTAGGKTGDTTTGGTTTGGSTTGGTITGGTTTGGNTGATTGGTTTGDKADATPAANKVTVAKAKVSKSFKAAKLKKQAKTFALPKATADNGTPKWSVAKKDAKKVLTLKNGKIQVKKGAKKGAYTIKVKASVAKTAKYAAASKTVTVTVNVK